ncbi:MAG: hypothetical protein DDT31_00647 [Syntrophomonadaceae bacterium]|nr:hypothetical protein [Bacillota bacterium]
MIQKDYLSEVEVAHVQGQVLVDTVPEDRLTSIWAIVGKDILGFAAVVDSVEQVGSSWLIKFSPVTEIVAFRSGPVYIKGIKNPHTGEVESSEFHLDALIFQKAGLAERFCRLSQNLDSEKIGSYTPTIGEDQITP